MTCAWPVHIFFIMDIGTRIEFDFAMHMPRVALRSGTAGAVRVFGTAGIMIV